MRPKFIFDKRKKLIKSFFEVMIFFMSVMFL